MNKYDLQELWLQTFHEKFVYEQDAEKAAVSANTACDKALEYFSKITNEDNLN